MTSMKGQTPGNRDYDAVTAADSRSRCLRRPAGPSDDGAAPRWWPATGDALGTRCPGKEPAVSSASAAAAALAKTIAGLPLLDNHCHGVLQQNPTAAQLEALIDEGGIGAALGTTRWDSPVGLSLRRYCAPVLDLEPFATPAEYLARRHELGADEVNRRLLRAAGTSGLILDTGFRSGRDRQPGRDGAARRRADLGGGPAGGRRRGGRRERRLGRAVPIGVRRGADGPYDRRRRPEDDPGVPWRLRGRSEPAVPARGGRGGRALARRDRKRRRPA